MNDLRVALRGLLRHPGFALAVLLTLALGIGGTTIAFALVETILLRPLPYAEPERLAAISLTNPEERVSHAPVSLPDFRDWKDQATSVEALTAFPRFAFRGLLRTGEGEPEELRTGYVDGDFFRTLGVTPRYGRFFGRDQDREGANQVVVLGDHFWRRRYAADPAVIGRTVRLDDQPYTIVAVAPPELRLPEPDVEVWAPLSVIDSTRTPHHLRLIRWLTVLARLRPGISPDRAAQEFGLIADRIAEGHPDANAGWTAVSVVPLREELVGDTRRTLVLLFGAVTLVLLVVCVNVAGLLLARAVRRRQDFALRAALGARPTRLARQLLAEALLLGVAGGLAGFALAAWGLEAVVRLAGQRVPRIAEVGLDPVLIAGAIGLTLVTSLLFGAAPAWLAVRSDLRDVLQEGGRTTGSRRVSLARAALATAEVAMAMSLTVGAGLLINSIWRLSRVEPGFRPDGLLALEFVISGTRYRTPPEYLAAYEAMLNQVRQVPGVVAVGGAQQLPGTGVGESTSFDIPEAPAPPGQLYEAVWRTVSPGYFETLGIPVLAGRAFDSGDRRTGVPVAVVSRGLARRLWPGGDVVGRRIVQDSTAITVVGVVGDVRHAGLRTTPEEVLYQPVAQHSRRRIGLAVRTRGEPEVITGAVVEAIRRINPEQPMTRITTASALLSNTIAESRLLTLVLGGFALLGLVLAVTGTYGVIAYSVAQRRREIGVRLALGARRGDVAGLVLADGVRIGSVGIAIGLLLSLLGGGLLGEQLFEVGAGDPVTLGIAAVGLFSVVLLASYAPAYSAGRIDPMDALRHE